MQTARRKKGGKKKHYLRIQSKFKSSLQKKSTVVITIWLTVTKYPYLK